MKCPSHLPSGWLLSVCCSLEGKLLENSEGMVRVDWIPSAALSCTFFVLMFQCLLRVQISMWAHPVKHWNRSIQLCQAHAVSQVHEQAKGMGIAEEEEVNTLT